MLCARVRIPSIDNVQIFEANWEKAKKCILAAFTLFEKIGFNNITFRAKNAAIPIIYYIYYHNLEDSIVKATYDENDKKEITRWLSLTFIKSIFGGQTDSVLVTMRKVLKETDNAKFPAQELMDAFKNNPARNYSFDEDFLDGLLETQKDSNDAFYVLHLLYPDLDYYNQDFHQDHLHPATIFEDETKFVNSIPLEDQEFAKNKKNWNSVLNLQLLNGDKNKSKNKKSLDRWVKEQKIEMSKLYLSDDTSLDIKDFKKFIEDRRNNIKTFLKRTMISIFCD